MEKIIENDRVYIVKGTDEEIYLIDDPEMIAMLDQIFNNHPEDEAMALVLPLLNPQKYKNGTVH